MRRRLGAIAGTLFEALADTAIALGVRDPPPLKEGPRGAEFLAALTGDDPKRLDRMLARVVRAYDTEERRLAAVEAKAATVLSALGVTASLALGASGLLLGSVRTLDAAGRPWLVAVVACYLFALVLLGYALAQAGLAVAVGKWFWARPVAEDVVDLQGATEANLLRDELAALLASYVRNKATSDRKAAHVDAAQRALVRAIFGLLPAAGLIALYAVLTAYGLL